MKVEWCVVRHITHLRPALWLALQALCPGTPRLAPHPPHHHQQHQQPLGQCNQHFQTVHFKISALRFSLVCGCPLAALITSLHCICMAHLPILLSPHHSVVLTFKACCIKTQRLPAGLVVGPEWSPDGGWLPGTHWHPLAPSALRHRPTDLPSGGYHATPPHLTG